MRSLFPIVFMLLLLSLLRSSFAAVTTQSVHTYHKPCPNSCHKKCKRAKKDCKKLDNCHVSECIFVDKKGNNARGWTCTEKVLPSPSVTATPSPSPSPSPPYYSELLYKSKYPYTSHVYGRQLDYFCYTLYADRQETESTTFKIIPLEESDCVVACMEIALEGMCPSTDELRENELTTCCNGCGGKIDGRGSFGSPQCFM